MAGTVSATDVIVEILQHRHRADRDADRRRAAAALSWGLLVFWNRHPLELVEAPTGRPLLAAQLVRDFDDDDFLRPRSVRHRRCIWPPPMRRLLNGGYAGRPRRCCAGRQREHGPARGVAQTVRPRRADHAAPGGVARHRVALARCRAMRWAARPALPTSPRQRWRILR